MSAPAVSSDYLPPFSATPRSGTSTNPHPRPAHGSVLEFVVGDLTREVSDAIVNPAGAGLVDLAIRRAAGLQLLDAFHQGALELPGGKLSPGRAILTPGFDLAAGRVIHVDPPVYADDPIAAAKNLASVHTEALRLARAHDLASISIPAVATGIHRYPAALAAEIAVGTVVADLRAHGAPATVRFVLATSSMLEIYSGAARAHFAEAPTRSERGIIFSELRRGSLA